MLDQDVEVADRTENTAEPAELEPERLVPAWDEERLARTKEGTQPAGCDSHLVKLLRIRAEAGSGVVGEDRPVLSGEDGLQVGRGRG